MWQSLAGAGALVVRDNLVLMVYRERSEQTRWELPSGLVEAGESLEEAAARETSEETGVSVQVGALLCTAIMNVPSENYRGINAYFYAKVVSERSPVANQTEPIRRVAFVDPSTLRPRDIHPVDRRILNRWRRSLPAKPFCFQITL